MPRSDAPEWQCVMVLWGDKYDVAVVNRLICAIATHTKRQPRFVLLSDRARPGLDPRADLRAIPAFWLQEVFRRSGCQTKLSMFEAGVLQDDLPALYIDLDTIVTGDLTILLDRLPRPDGLMLLQSAILPLGPIGRFFWRMTKGRKYARGNSSLVVFHPRYHHNIAAQFVDLWAKEPSFWFRPMIADERFISWASQAVVSAIPNSLAVKLPAEFMSRLTVLSYVWALLPMVRARRGRLIAVTLCGLDLKPERLLALPEGGRVTDAKGRTLIWSDFVLGKTRQAIISFYSSPIL